MPAPEPPYAFFHPAVVRTERLSPSLTRVVLGGDPALARVVSGGRDQRFKIFLPRPGQAEPVLPGVLDTDWYPRWRALDPAVRGVMRTYTIRDVRTGPCELDVDFALHGDLGPASAWARRARPGDRLAVLAPVVPDNGGVDFHLPADTDFALLTGDETALPALAGILAALPPGLPVRAFIDVAHPADRLPLPTKADADVRWLVRAESGRDVPGHRGARTPDRGSRLLSAVAAASLPAGRGYAWIAGEASCVRALRGHLVAERGFPRETVVFTGYWRQGTTEDQLLEAAAADTEAGA